MIASDKQVKNTESRLRSVADNFTIAIFKVKGERLKVKGHALSWIPFPLTFRHCLFYLSKSFLVSR